MTHSQDSAEQQVESGASTPKICPLERFLTVAEIAAAWRLSTDTVRRIFQREAGVVAISQACHRGKRRYVTLRIPESVLERVRRKLSLVK